MASKPAAGIFYKTDFELGLKHRNLIERIISDDNMRDAYRKTAAGRRMSDGALTFKEYSEYNLGRLALDLHSGEYVPGTAHRFYVYEPKARLISALPFRDRVAQHAVHNVIAPIFEATFLPRSFACRKGMGTHAGVKAVQAELRRMSAGGPVYFLKTDFSRFFSSIERNTLNSMIRKKISCTGAIRVIEAMVPPDGIGLPIGSLTSQLFANVYATALDRFLSQELFEKVWFRYMDDMVILGRDMAHLHAVRAEIERFSAERLGLRFSKWSVAPASRGINFLGYRIWAGHKLLRRDSVARAKRKIRVLRATGQTEKLDKFVAAWVGHAQWADSRNLLRHLQLRA